jgi:peptidyl-prolyl cis-trans isomerase B (cyclophilin B)
MARATEETSQGSQFFLVYKDSPIPGKYTVLGQVTDGLDVVQTIADGGVVGGGPGGTSDGAPARPISITKATAEQN